MDQETRLEKNRSGFWELRWTERTGTGGYRTRSVSTRTADRNHAEAFKRTHDREVARAATGGELGSVLEGYFKACDARGVVVPAWRKGVISDYFAGMTLDDLTPEAVMGYAAARGVAGPTVRRELVTVKAALAWAHKHGRIGRVPYIELPAHGLSKSKFYDEQTAAELFTLASRDVGRDGRLSRAGRFIMLGLETGARKAAIEGLTWDRVNLGTGMIDFRDPDLRVTKKRRANTPITQKLRPMLERMRNEKQTDLVLDDGSDVRGAFDWFMGRHGFEDATPHVLRHTRITLLLRAGVSLWDVSKLVGASTAVLDAVYAHHVQDDRLKDLANRVA